MTVASAAYGQNMTAMPGLEALQLLEGHSQQIATTAMELTDSWGQAMFIMDPGLVHSLFTALGFPETISSKVFDRIRSISYVKQTEGESGMQPEVTWHAMDATCATLRGFGSSDRTSEINDENLGLFLRSNLDVFEKLLGVMPEYTRRLMFSPEVASTVMATLGVRVSADAIYKLAVSFGHPVTRDLDGRRGVSTQFIRSLTLTISARGSFH